MTVDNGLRDQESPVHPTPETKHAAIKNVATQDLSKDLDCHVNSAARQWGKRFNIR